MKSKKANIVSDYPLAFILAIIVIVLLAIFLIKIGLPKILDLVIPDFPNETKVDSREAQVRYELISSAVGIEKESCENMDRIGISCFNLGSLSDDDVKEIIVIRRLYPGKMIITGYNKDNKMISILSDEVFAKSLTGLDSISPSDFQSWYIADKSSLMIKSIIPKTGDKLYNEYRWELYLWR